MGRLASMTLTASSGTVSVTTWERDPQTGRLACKKVNGTVTETYAWQPNGQPALVTRPTGTVSNQYNAAGDRIALVDTPTNYAAETVTTAFDRPGNVITNAVAGGIAEGYANYIDGTLLGVQLTGNGVVPDYATALPLNLASGQALGCILTQGGTVRNLAVFYNATSYVTNVIDNTLACSYAWTPGGSATNITWSVAGVPFLTLANGWNEALGVRTNMAYTMNNAIVASFAFQRGPGTSQISRIVREDGSTREISYDDNGQLAGWKYKNAAGVADYDRSWLYKFDDAGNLISAGRDPSIAGSPIPMSPLCTQYATQNIRPTSTFTVDDFNFHTVRKWNAVDLVCYAATNAHVTVNGMAARQNGTRFVVSIPLAQNSSASVTNLTVCAVMSTGTNSESYFTNTVQLSLPAYPESIQTALATAVTGDSVMSYTFDARNQLRQVTDQPGATPNQLQSTYDYYPDRRRARKVVTIWDGSAWQPYRTCQYIYDRWNLIREIVTANGITTTRDYTWGLDLAGLQDGQWGQIAGGIGGLLAITEVQGTSTNIFLPICDHVGTVHALVAAMTNSVPCVPFVAATYEYTPFGELIAQDGPYANSCPFLFMSKYRDTETGHYNFGLRIYDARIAQCLTTDPIGIEGGLNTVVLFGNDPVNEIDPLGLEIGQTPYCGGLPFGYIPYLQTDASVFSLGIWEHAYVGLANIGNLLGNVFYGSLDGVGQVGTAVDRGFEASIGVDTMGLMMAAQQAGPRAAPGVLPYAAARSLRAVGGFSRFMTSGEADAAIARLLDRTAIGLRGTVSANPRAGFLRIGPGAATTSGEMEAALTRVAMLHGRFQNEQCINAMKEMVENFPAGCAKSAAATREASLWTKAEFNGTRVYQRDDLINPNLADKLGRSNLQRMQEGLAPLGSDGKPINLHHMLQTADSPIAELSQTFHQQNSSVIHINPSTMPSGINRGVFDVWRSEYWMSRVSDF